MFMCKVCQKEFSNKGGFIVHEKTCERIFQYKEEIKKLYNEDLWSIREVAKKFSVGTGIITNLLGEDIRTPSEGAIVAHKKYPETFKHSEQTKDVLRVKRLNFIKNNPDKTAWRTKNISYPEKLFLTKITELGWDKKYSIVRELSIFPFFIDFAFMNENVAIEIDGSQHLLPDRKERDEKKDKLLIENGWTIIRISENEIKKNIDETLVKLEKILLSSLKEKKYEFGVLTLLKKREKKERGNNGLTEEEYNAHIKQRKVQRPEYTILCKMVEDEGFVSVGKKYGVSDNCVRNWLRFYRKYEL